MTDTGSTVDGVAPHAPRWVKALVAVMVAGLVTITAATVIWVSWRHNEEALDCGRSVKARDDNRAMWLYLVDQNPTNPNVPAFVAELNQRLPPLHCNSSRNPVP